MWRTNSIPTLREWKVNVYYFLFLMSKLSAISRTRLGTDEARYKFRSQWSWTTDNVFAAMNSVCDGYASALLVEGKK